MTLGIGRGDEVICPSMSYIATANSIRHAGATPVFADIDPATCNLDPVVTEAAITPRTKAILVVHQIGIPLTWIDSMLLAAKHGVRILEDAACEFGSRYRGVPIGGHTEMACFSLHPRQGTDDRRRWTITTNNPDYADTPTLAAPAWNERFRHGSAHGANQVVTEEYVCLGYNYRMTDIQAAVGIEQLKKLDQIVERRGESAVRDVELRRTSLAFYVVRT